MSEVRLSFRMQKIADEITFLGEKVLADIGCDHGLIPIYLLKNACIDRAYLVDISPKSLDKAVNLAQKNKLADKVIPIICDGLDNQNINNADIISITGMGGYEIIHILENAVNKPKHIVLSPNNNSDKLRRFLSQNGYEIIKDYLIFDNGKSYDIIICIIGSCNLSDDEIMFGKTNLIEKSNDFIKFLLQEIQKSKSIRDALQPNHKKIGELNAYIKKIEEILYED